jgi:hypothetical protein
MILALKGGLPAKITVCFIIMATQNPLDKVAYLIPSP